MWILDKSWERISNRAVTGPPNKQKENQSKWKNTSHNKPLEQPYQVEWLYTNMLLVTAIRGREARKQKKSNFSKNSTIFFRMPWFSEKCIKKIFVFMYTLILISWKLALICIVWATQYSNCNRNHDLKLGSVLLY